MNVRDFKRSSFVPAFAALAAAGALLLAGCPRSTAGPGPGPDSTPKPTPRTAVRPTPTAKPSATPAPALARPKGQALVEWTAYAQRDIARFEVYRAEASEGPWTRATSDEDYIQGEGYTDEPKEYSFLDEGLEPGKKYYYRIDRVGLTGRRSRHTNRDLVRVAKLPESR